MTQSKLLLLAHQYDATFKKTQKMYKEMEIFNH